MVQTTRKRLTYKILFIVDLIRVLILKCYGPYKQDSTDSQKGLRLTQDQYARGGTNKTSKAIGRGVAELYNRT